MCVFQSHDVERMPIKAALGGGVYDKALLAIFVDLYDYICGFIGYKSTNIDNKTHKYCLKQMCKIFFLA